MNHSMHGRLATAWLLLAATLHPLRAEVKWDAQKLDLKPSPTEAVAEAMFGFVNAGKSEATIEAVKSSCGCTVPTLAKMTYAPGERGEVTARFNIGDRRGAQTATIRVSVKGEREPALLTLNVAIPEVARLTPTILIWAPGEKKGAKSMEVEALPGQTLSVEKVATSALGFAAKVETVAEGTKYRVVVTPPSAETASFALLEIETKIREGVKVLRAYAQVRSNVKGAPSPALPPAPPAAVVEIEPALLAWDQGSAPMAKTLEVRAPSGSTAKLGAVIASTANFDITNETVTEGTAYRLTITPKSTEKAELSFLKIEIDTGAGPAIQRAYVQIAPAAK